MIINHINKLKFTARAVIFALITPILSDNTLKPYNITAMTVSSHDNLAAIVRRHRSLSGLSQAGVAKLAGVGKTAVFDLEHGKKSMRLETVIKILAVLNIKMLFEPPIVHEAHDLKASNLTTETPTP